MRSPLGQILLQKKIITEEQLKDALEIQEKTGSTLGQILISYHEIRPLLIDQTIAEQFNLKYYDIATDHESIILSDLDLETARFCVDNLAFPLNDSTWIVADLDEKKMNFLREKLGPEINFAITTRYQVLYQLHLGFKNQFSDLSVYALVKSFPDYSAGKVFLGKQLLVIYLMILASISWMFVAPWSFLLIVNVFVTIFLIVSFGFKFLLVWKGSHLSVENKITKEDVDALNDKDLPMYTVLVPMYKEPEVLPIIVQSLKNMDYPKEKLDIKIVLEEDDDITLKKAHELNLEEYMEIIIVPKSMPKTKPKACNYALFFARGEYLTIYDAEDIPEPDQLKKAIACFKISPPKTAVVQARLNFFNPNENWLTRMFTMEYSLWFDFYLPALERIGVPIPLGGTSNHFKTSILRTIGAWDPFNVTEDADLGIRFSQQGYIVQVVNSTTYEEANTHYGNWIRQRSRWMKGYMQTYLVHMRTPFALWAKIGSKAFFSFQFFIGGTFLTALVTPILYSVYFWWLLTKTSIFDPLFIQPILYLSVLNLLMGNAFFIYIQMIGLFKRKYYDLIPWALTTPVYWMILSLAAMKGLYQLFTNPFFWEKTQHGLSKQIKNAKLHN